MNSVLWVVQMLLAAAFLAHGWLFLSPPPDIAVQMNASLPRWFSLFLGVAEVLAAVGLTLPGLTRILPWLVTWAAAGVMIVTVVGDGLPSDARGVQLGGDHPAAVRDGDVPRLHAPSCRCRSAAGAPPEHPGAPRPHGGRLLWQGAYDHRLGRSGPSVATRDLVDSQRATSNGPGHW